MLIGHIFGIGGYDTSGVSVVWKKLQEKYGDRYQELAEMFGETNMRKDEISTQNNKRTIVLENQRERIDRDNDGKVVQKRVEHFKYIYTDNGSGPSEEEVKEKFEPLMKKVGEDLYYPDQNGKLVLVK